MQKEAVIHDARMHSDMRHMFINHHTFAFDTVFGDRASNDEVRTARSSVRVTLCR